MEKAQETKQEETKLKTIGEKIKEVVFGKKSDEETSQSEVVETTVETEPTAEEPKADEVQEDVLSNGDMDAAIEKAKAEAIEEYKKAEAEKERKASLTPEELKAEEDAEKDKKIQALEHEIMVNNSKNDAIKKLDEAGLPVKLADIINYSTKESAEASLEHIIKTYSECLENGIKEKLKGKTPEGLRSNTAINNLQDKQNSMRKYMGIK